MLNYDNYSQSLEFLFFYFQASGTKLMDEKYHWFVLTKVKKKRKTNNNLLSLSSP